MISTTASAPTIGIALVSTADVIEGAFSPGRASVRPLQPRIEVIAVAIAPPAVHAVPQNVEAVSATGPNSAIAPSAAHPIVAISTHAPMRAQYSRSSSSVQKVASPAKSVPETSTTIKTVGGAKQTKLFRLYWNAVVSGVCRITIQRMN